MIIWMKATRFFREKFLLLDQLSIRATRSCLLAQTSGATVRRYRAYNKNMCKGTFKTSYGPTLNHEGSTYCIYSVDTVGRHREWNSKFQEIDPFVQDHCLGFAAQYYEVTIFDLRWGEVRCLRTKHDLYLKLWDIYSIIVAETKRSIDGLKIICARIQTNLHRSVNLLWAVWRNWPNRHSVQRRQTDWSDVKMRRPLREIFSEFLHP